MAKLPKVIIAYGVKLSDTSSDPHDIPAPPNRVTLRSPHKTSNEDVVSGAYYRPDTGYRVKILLLVMYIDI